MKKLIALIPVLFVFYCAKSQSYTVPRLLPSKDSRFVENTGVAGASYLFDSLVMFRNMADTQMKPLYPALAYIQNFAGDSTFWVWDMVRWKKLTGSGGGSGGTNNTNLGSAYRWLNETSQGIKTANNGFGISIDSLTTGELTFTADTSQIPTRYTIDSLGQLISEGGGGTVTSVGLSMPSAFTVTNSPVTTSGTLTVTGAGTTAQYIRGDGSLATFPYIPSGTVTSVATNNATGITGGTITSTGTLAIDTFHITTRDWFYKGIDSIADKFNRAYTTVTQLNDTSWTINRFDGTKDTILMIGGGGTSLSLSPIGSSPNANGMTLIGSALNLEPASASFGGAVTTATQTFAGDKTLIDNTYLTGTVQTNATSENGNFYIPSSAGIGTSTNSRYTIAALSTEFRSAIGGGSTNVTLGANHQYAQVIIPQSTVTEAASGSHNALAQLYIGGLTVTNAGASVTRTAVLYLGATGGATGATNYGIYNSNSNNFIGNIVTDVNTVTSQVTTATGASSFGAGGTNVNFYAKQTATNTTNNVININSSTTANATSGTQTVVAVQGNVSNQANGTAVGANYIAFRSDLQNNGSGTVTNLIGYDANILTGSGAAASTAGTISNYYGFKANGLNVGDSTTITNFTQYYADSVIQFWRITNPIYGFYQKGTHMRNFFAGTSIFGYNGGINTGSQLQTTSFSVGYKTTAVDYTATATDNVIEVTATGKTVTLPTAVGIQGRQYTIKLTASGSGTVATTSSQNIDASTTYSLSAQYKYVTVVSNGSNWLIAANN